MQPHLVEPERLCHEQAALGDLGERGPAPERERLGERLRRILGPAVRERAGAGRRALLEAVDVAAAARDVQHVGVAPGLDRVAPECAAQIRDVALDDVARRRRRGVAPDLVDQAADRDRPVRADHEHGEHRAAARAADGDDTVAFEHLERTENPVVVHGGGKRTPATSRRAGTDGPPGRAVRCQPRDQDPPQGPPLPAALARAEASVRCLAAWPDLGAWYSMVPSYVVTTSCVGRRVLHEDDAARPCGSRRCFRSPGARSCRAAVRPSPGRRMPST